MMTQKLVILPNQLPVEGAFCLGPKVTNKCQQQTLHAISFSYHYFYIRPTQQIASLCRAALSGKFGI